MNEEIAAFVSLLPSSIDTSRTNKPGMWESDEQTRSDSAVLCVAQPVCETFAGCSPSSRRQTRQVGFKIHWQTD